VRYEPVLTPDVPLMTGDTMKDMQLLRGYLTDLQAMIEEPMDIGWSVVGTSESKTLVAGGTLGDLYNVVGTLVKLLLVKGILQ
jgi:hypothetical protein